MGVIKELAGNIAFLACSDGRARGSAGIGGGSRVADRTYGGKMIFLFDLKIFVLIFLVCRWLTFWLLCVVDVSHIYLLFRMIVYKYVSIDVLNAAIVQLHFYPEE